MKYLATAIVVIAVLVGIQNHGVSLRLPQVAAGANCNLKDDNSQTAWTRNVIDLGACQTLNYMRVLNAKRPYPEGKVTDSVERKNLTEKLLRFNDVNKIAYVTLLSDYGTVIATYTIQGKVSSNQSALTNSDSAYCKNGDKEWGCTTVHSPGDDGSYGENEPGIFFFTTSGVLVQWNGKYLLTDAPQQIVSAPVVTYNVSDKPSSSIDIK